MEGESRTIESWDVTSSVTVSCILLGLSRKGVEDLLGFARPKVSVITATRDVDTGR